MNLSTLCTSALSLSLTHEEAPLLTCARLRHVNRRDDRGLRPWKCNGDIFRAVNRRAASSHKHTADFGRLQVLSTWFLVVTQTQHPSGLRAEAGAASYQDVHTVPLNTVCESSAAGERASAERFHIGYRSFSLCFHLHIGFKA